MSIFVLFGMSRLLQRILPLRLSEHKREEVVMRFIIRTVMLIALVWIGLLLSGYGVLIGSKENAAGLGLQCTYLTARGTSTVQYLHTKSGFLGITDCPLLRKSNIVVDNG